MARRRLDAEASRSLILDAAERLMRQEGYGAVNTRTVAAEAGVKPPLVHYHFATTDNLLLAFYNRSAARSEALLAQAIAAENPLRAIWEYNIDPHRTALAAEFMALANHRDSIRQAMSRNVAKFRTMQATALKTAFENGIYREALLLPGVLIMLISAVGRALVMEQTIGISAEHDPTKAYIEALISDLEGSHRS
jgi:AcrR family transcriptional regulator